MRRGRCWRTWRRTWRRRGPASRRTKRTRRAPQRSNHVVLQRAFFLSSILSSTGPPNLVNTPAISSCNLERNSFRIGDRARVLGGGPRSASSRADVGENPLAVLRHLPDRRGWRHSLVVTRTPHNHLDKHGREGEPLCRKPIDQPPRVSSIAPLPDDAFRLQALQTVRQDVGGDPFPPGEEVLVRGAPLEHRSEEHTSELQSRSDLVCRLLLEKKKKPQPSPI